MDSQLYLFNERKEIIDILKETKQIHVQVHFFAIGHPKI